jgi:cobalamin biosynthesis Mg chelatase CobN
MVDDIHIDGRTGAQSQDPSSLTMAQIFREIGSLKELVFTRLDAMDLAMRIFNENITRGPTDVDKQISNLRTLHDSKINSLDEKSVASREARDVRIDSIKEESSLQVKVIETRLDGMDRALELLQATADKFPGRIDEKIKSLEQVHEEKFTSIKTQFQERDTRTEQNARDTKVAVDAALQAAEKAVGKQQESFALATSKSEAATTKQIDQQGEIIRQTVKASDEKIDDIKQRLMAIEGKALGAATSTATHQTSSRDWISVIAVLVAIGALILAFVRHA